MFGRSLTYRFAMAGFWSAVAFAELELEPPLTWGVVKGLLLRSLRWWAGQRDALSLQGTLTIGYTYPNQFLSENYNSPGSPYWYMLGFAALALPESHVFWQCAEAPYPSASIPRVLALKQPKHIMMKKGGHTFLLSSGQMCHYPMRAAESKYGKFAYSSAFGYSVSTGGYFVQAIGGDNMLALSDDEGETWKVRRVPLDARIEEYEGKPVLASGWEPWRDVRVETYLIPPDDDTPNWHLRAHRVTTSRALMSSEGAFAINGERASDGRELESLSDDTTEGRRDGVGEALALSRSGAVGIAELLSTIRTGKVIDEDANSNLLYSRSVLPTLTSNITPHQDVWMVTAVFAMPASVEGWQQSWRVGWQSRPEIPRWLKEKLQDTQNS
jgi:hypothetical protein